MITQKIYNEYNIFTITLKKVTWIAFENFRSHAFLLFTCMQNYAAHERKSNMVKSANVAHAKH